MRLLAACGVFFLSAAGFAGDNPSGSRVPVLVELFTSEGCSSCPPADRLLTKLDREQPVGGANIVVLSEHVDYWNQLGWKDPFSSAAFSQRQRDYAEMLSGDVYTPEMVVDGAKGFVGSNESDALRAIRDAAHKPKAAIRIDAHQENGKARIVLHMDEAADGPLYLALAHEAKQSQVLRGENAGRGLSHVAVVYSIQKLGKLDRTASGFEKEVVVSSEQGTRVVAFATKSGAGRITAIGQARLDR
jgi:hypothetical protein